MWFEGPGGGWLQMKNSVGIGQKQKIKMYKNQ
jgi:hypothetical protein